MIPGLRNLHEQEQHIIRQIRRESDLRATYQHLGAYSDDEIVNNIEYLHGLVLSLQRVRAHIKATEVFYDERFF